MADAKETFGASAEHDSNPGSPIEEPRKTLTRREKFKRHHKRFWWLYLIVFIVCVLVITLPVVYVGYPRIAQNQIDDSTLTAVDLALTEASPQQVTIHVGSRVGTSSSYHPTIESFEAHFILEGRSTVPFVNATVPRQVGVHDGDVQEVAQRIDVKQGFVDYLTAMLLQENVGVRLKGSTKLQQGKLPKANINYNKLVVQKGFNSLQGLKTENLTILTTPEPDGANFVAQLVVPNPTVTTIDMGNVTLSLTTPIFPPLVETPSYVNIGEAHIAHLKFIKNMTSTFELRSVTNQSLVLELFTANQTYRETGILPVYVQGTRSEVNGAEIPYYSKVLSSNVILQELDIGGALKKAGLGSVLGNGTSGGS